MTLEPEQIKISPMPKTWILDLDGTLMVHDGPYILGRDEFLPGAREFLDSIPKRDMIILLTARSDYEKPHTMHFLKEIPSLSIYDPNNLFNILSLLFMNISVT